MGSRIGPGRRRKLLCFMRIGPGRRGKLLCFMRIGPGSRRKLLCFIRIGPGRRHKLLCFIIQIGPVVSKEIADRHTHIKTTDFVV